MGNKISNAASTVYHDVSNEVDTVTKAIGKVPDHIENVVDNVIQTGGSVVKTGINEVSGIVHSAENIVTIPLILIAGGIAFMLFKSNSSTLESIGVQAVKRIP